MVGNLLANSVLSKIYFLASSGECIVNSQYTQKLLLTCISSSFRIQQQDYRMFIRLEATNAKPGSNSLGMPG